MQRPYARLRMAASLMQRTNGAGSDCEASTCGCSERPAHRTLSAWHGEDRAQKGDTAWDVNLHCSDRHRIRVCSHLQRSLFLLPSILCRGLCRGIQQRGVWPQEHGSNK
ncbi:trans-sialidase [Trypanosoma cruzi]|nr:trans-sialidase [Trypanosoma cruzi]